MNTLNPREREVVALGAAMGSHCAPCIEYHIAEAGKAGLEGSQISQAISLADKGSPGPGAQSSDGCSKHAGRPSRKRSRVRRPPKIPAGRRPGAALLRLT